jgi:hypothetical protein
MLALTAPKILAGMKSRHIELGLTAELKAQSRAMLERHMQGGQHLTRDELQTLYAQNGIDATGNRLSHLLSWAELEGVICSGRLRGAKTSYALLEERVPPAAPLAKAEALARLASIYFTSRGPASLADFTWWSGLTAGDARRALAGAAPGLISEEIDGSTYWFSPHALASAAADSAFFLPAFDEIIISYADRRAAMPLELQRKAVSSNGIFRPVIVLNGQAVGLWQRKVVKGTVTAQAQFFDTNETAAARLLAAAAEQYSQFFVNPA